MKTTGGVAAGINRFRDHGRDVGAWLQTIARNLIYDHLWSARHNREFPVGDDMPDHAEMSAVEASLLAAEGERLLLRAIDRLSDDQRECVRLRFLRGMSVAGAATAMGRSENAVKAVTFRAVRRLAIILTTESVRTVSSDADLEFAAHRRLPTIP